MDTEEIMEVDTVEAVEVIEAEATKPPQLVPAKKVSQAELMAAIKGSDEEVLSQLLESVGSKRGMLEHCFKIACVEGYATSVQIFISVGKIDPSIDDNFGLKAACRNGQAAVIQILLDNGVDPTVQNNYPIRLTITNNRIAATKVLLADPRTTFWDAENEAVISIIRSGYTDMFKLLIESYPLDPQLYSEINSLLAVAVDKAQVEILKLVLKDYRSDPTIGNYAMIKLAEQRRNGKISMLLRRAVEKHKIFSNEKLTPIERVKNMFVSNIISMDNADVSFSLDGNNRKVVLTFEL